MLLFYRLSREEMLRKLSALALLVCIALPAWAGPAEDKALRDAASKLDIAGVKAALNAGADPNAPSMDARPFTPLGFAALLRGEADENAKSLEIAKVLFAAGAKLGTYDREILFFPIADGNVPLVKLLVSKGASVTRDHLGGYTPPELAKKYGQEEIYAYLVKHGGVPVDGEAAAQIALVEAASRGDTDAMEQALKDGARIEGLAPDNMTALVAAIRNPIYLRSRAAAIWWLLDHGADPNQVSESGFTGVDGIPLHIFVLSSTDPLRGAADRPEMKQLAEETMARLLKAGAKVSGMDTMGRTPLHLAAQADNVRGAEILIEEGARIMARDKTGKTPLDYAESGAMIKLLKANGATEL